MKSYYLPKSDDARVTWLNNFAAKLTATLTAKYALTPAQVSAVQADAVYFDALVKYKKQYENYLSSVTAYKNAMRNGVAAGSTLVPLVTPVLVLPGTAVAPGIFDRISEVVKKIKASQLYSAADGKNLGIEGNDIGEEDADDAKPKLTLGNATGQPKVEWIRKTYTAIEIQKDRGDGNWVFLAIDTVPNYIDTEALPATGTMATWKYRARYRKGDEPVGQWSDVVSVNVTQL